MKFLGKFSSFFNVALITFSASVMLSSDQSNFDRIEYGLTLGNTVIAEIQQKSRRRKKYYLMITHLDGRFHSLPQLLEVKNREQAEKIKEAQQKLYPGCKVQLIILEAE